MSSAYTSAGVDVSAPLAELREFKPHVIVSAAGPEFVTILRTLEEDRLGAEQQRPFYVLSPYQLGQRSELSNAVLQGYVRGRDLQQRIVGVHHAGALDPVPYDRYLARLQGKFPSAKYLERTEQFYDAAYFVAYAATAGARTPFLTGRDLTEQRAAILGGEASGAQDDAIVAVVGRNPANGVSYSCTGALVAPNLLLTAVSCLSVQTRVLGFSCTADGELENDGSGAGELGALFPPEEVRVSVGPERGTQPSALGQASSERAPRLCARTTLLSSSSTGASRPFRSCPCDSDRRLCHGDRLWAQ